jgi:hypothetical protein
LTGNYTFFNLLAVALCLFLFDDRDFERKIKWPPMNADKRGSKKKNKLVLNPRSSAFISG